MSTIFARTQRSISKRVFSQQFLFAKRWESGQYLGYVAYFNDEKLNGIIAREDAPENTYSFTASDIHAVTIPRARKYQQVAFHGTSKQGRYFAKDITTPNGDPLVYSYQNLRLPRRERTQNLSSTNDWETARFRGVVRNFDGRQGFIVPIEFGYTDVYFHANDLQTAGKETIPEGAEVEFSVLPRETRQDKAVNVTRPGGGLITEGPNAKARRQLGAMYKETDTEARIPTEFAGAERRQGYVVSLNPDASHGYIMPFDDPTQLMFVNLDDCHIYGKRALRKFQHVEFFPQNISSGEMKAIHVTGPDRSVLRYNSPNAFTPKSLADKHFKPSDTERHTGIVVRSDPEKNFFFIKPDEYGYANVFAPVNSVLRLNVGRLQAGAQVEFTVTEGFESGENGEKNLRAGVVTAAGGRPFCDTRGTYGRYLAKRFDHAKPQKDLPECPLKESGEKYNGWIAKFSGETKKGTIEVEAPEGERYRRVLFELQNANLGDQTFDETKFLQLGTEVAFELREVADDKKTFKGNDGKEMESTLTQEAFNVTSIDSEFLRLKVAEERQRPQKKAL